MSRERPAALTQADHIPQFSSEEEEREWWATHDSSGLAGEDVELRHVGTPEVQSRAVTVRVDEETMARLKGLAARRGVEHDALVRAWIMDRLQREAPAT